MSKKPKKELLWKTFPSLNASFPPIEKFSQNFFQTGTKKRENLNALTSGEKGQIFLSIFFFFSRTRNFKVFFFLTMPQ